MTNPTTSTLDLERTDQLRTFLTLEAAADAASSPAGSPHRGRRVLGGVAAALVLGGALFAAASVAGGPSTGPARVDTAHALEIEATGDGWTRISVADIDADPDAVIAELTAAGIDARRQSLGLAFDADGNPMLSSMDLDPTIASGFTVIGAASTGDAGARGLAGITLTDPSGGPQAGDANFTEYAERTGFRIDLDDGSVSIRDDSDAVVIVLTAT